MTTHDTPGPGDGDGPCRREGSTADSIRACYQHFDQHEVPQLIRELWEEAREAEGSLRELDSTVKAVCHPISDAGTRRQVQRLGVPLAAVRGMLDESMDEVAAIAECADELAAELDPDAHGAAEVDAARHHLEELRSVLAGAEETGRGLVHLGELAVARVSGLAEAEMLYQQISRDLARWEDGGRSLEVGGYTLGAGGVAVVNERIDRLSQIESEIGAGTIVKLIAEVTTRRDHLTARGGGAPEEYDDDYTI